MIEEKFAVGRVITLPASFGEAPIAKPHEIGKLLKVEAKPFTIGKSTGFSLMPGKERKATVTEGTGAAAHRDFNFLPWVAGVVSYANLDRDTITGPMSGCWLTTFMKDGFLQAGHVGTDTDKTKTDKANKAWNDFAAAHPGDVVGAFNPFRHWTGAYPKAQGGEEPLPKFFGIYTTTRQFWILCAFNRSQTHDLRVAGLRKQAAVTDLNKLQHIDVHKT